jgi:hypothetical protein
MYLYDGFEDDDEETEISRGKAIISILIIGCILSGLYFAIQYNKVDNKVEYKPVKQGHYGFDSKIGCPESSDIKNELGVENLKGVKRVQSQYDGKRYLCEYVYYYE